jgi:hypothetical protein
MRIPATYKKIGTGIYFSEKLRKVKLLVKRVCPICAFGAPAGGLARGPRPPAWILSKRSAPAILPRTLPGYGP